MGCTKAQRAIFVYRTDKSSGCMRAAVPLPVECSTCYISPEGCWEAFVAAFSASRMMLESLAD